MERRRFIGLACSLVAGLFVGKRWVLGAALAQVGSHRWLVRPVCRGDEEQLVELMKSCVSTTASFHGRCNPIEWTADWAASVVRDRPRALVMTIDETVVGFFDLPTKRPKLTGEPTVDHYRRAFWCGAAGVRMDLLGRDQGVRVFQELLYNAFADAKRRGYEFVRAAAPWAQHPYLPQPFAEYPGLTVEPFRDVDGGEKFLLEWNLTDALVSLAGQRDKAV